MELLSVPYTLSLTHSQVTYRSLSRELGVHVNVAKKYFSRFPGGLDHG